MCCVHCVLCAIYNISHILKTGFLKEEGRKTHTQSLLLFSILLFSLRGEGRREEGRGDGGEGGEMLEIFI